MKHETRYIVKNKKELNALTKDFRAIGYNIITFCSDFRELEKDNHIIVIEIK